MISATAVSTIGLTYASAGAWGVFTAANLATAGNLQANWTDIASQLDNNYKPLLNSAVDEISALLNVPAARVYMSSSQIASASTVTKVTFDSERFDTDTMHSTSTNTSRLTCNTSGIYNIMGSVMFTANASGLRQVDIYYNDSTIIGIKNTAPISGDHTYLDVQSIYRLNTGDYVELRVYHDAGSSLALFSTSAYGTEFMMAKIG
jgi:hypothetical protein